ncbi:hypothetical protein FB451DRAFT_514349 [Mycena latifolia]|nr:hypothetical protein FB451DRAFT_514349 [Mycena latifolia]
MAASGPVRRQLLDNSTFESGATLIESDSLFTTVTTSSFVSEGQIKTTVIPITLTSASLIPYIPSQTSAPTPKSSLPILPIAAAAGGLVIILLIALGVFCLQRRRMLAARRTKVDPQLDLEIPPAPSASGIRTFSRLTFTAPYVVPQSDSQSTAAASTVSPYQL